MKKIKFAAAVTLMFATLPNVGCVHTGTEIRIQSNALGKVPSLSQLRQQVAQKPGGTLRILLVHGMSNHPFGEETEFKRRFNLTKNTYAALQAKFAEWESQSDFRKSVASAIGSAQFSEFVPQTAKRLGCPYEILPNSYTDKKPVEIIRHPSKPKTVLGYVLKRQFSSSQNGPAGVEFYICSWAMQAAIHKEDVYSRIDDGCHSGITSTFSDLAVFGNRARKKGIVNWGLTEAAIYVGGHQQEFQWAVAQAMANTLEGLDSRRGALAVVTASLGSAITIDTFKNLLRSKISLGGKKHEWRSDGDRNNLIQLLTESKHNKPVPFYMFANQYQLLAHAQAKSDYGDGATVEKLRRSGNVALQIQGIDGNGGMDPRLTAAIRSKNLQIQLVAFTDPDDLLSHPFEGIKDPDPEVKIGTTNVYVHNPKLRWLFIFANPGTAHGAYDKNRAVVHRMMSGN